MFQTIDTTFTNDVTIDDDVIKADDDADDDRRTSFDDDIESAFAAVKKTQQYSDLVARNFLENLGEKKEDLGRKVSNEGLNIYLNF